MAYSGVPSAGVSYGTAIQTGTGGTSNVDDYSVPVYGRNADGTFYRLPAGMTIPAGATISLATPPASSSTGGSAVTGTGIVDQAETQRHNVATETNATNTTAANAADSQNRYNLGVAGIQQSAQASAQRHDEAMAQMANEMAKAAAQYQLDSQRFGLEQATFNYNQARDVAANKLLAAQFGMSISQFNLSKDSFNAQQRQALAAAKLEVDKLLASKSGPQDWVAYNNLLNGMSRPTPSGTTVIDPYAGLADMYQPSTAVAPSMPDLSIPSTPSNISPAPFPSGNLLSGGNSSSSSTSSSGGGGVTIPAAVQPQTVQPFGGGAPSGTGTGITSSGGSGIAPPTPSSTAYANLLNGVRQVPSQLGASPTYNTGTVAAPATSQDQSGNTWEDNGTPGGLWHDQAGHKSSDGGATWLAGGGTTSGAAVVGDSKSGKPTGHEEIAYAATNPRTGVSELHVIPHERVARLIDEKLGRSNGTVIGAHKMPPNLLMGIPRAYSGGTFSAEDYGDAGGGGQDAFHQSGGGNLLQPKGAGGGSLGTGAGGFMTQAQPAAPAPTSMAAGPGNGWAGPSTTQPISAPGVMVNQGTTPATNAGMAYSTGTGGGGNSSPATSTPAQPVSSGTGLTAQNIAATSAQATPPPSANLLNGAPNPATAPATSTGYVHDAPGTYGSGNTQPYNVLNSYDPTTLGSQPFIQKILGNQPGREFGQFGAALSNPKLGINNMPFNISLQRYNLLAPSEQQQLKSLYEQGLGVNMDDVLAAAQRSAPVGHNRQTYAQAIQPATYGR